MRHPVGKMLTKEDNSQIRYNFLTENKNNEKKKRTKILRKVFSLALCFLSLYFFLLPVVVSFSAQLFIAYAFYFVCHRHKVHRTLFPAIFRKTQQFSSSHKTWQSVSVALVLCPTAEYKIGAGV